MTSINPYLIFNGNTEEAFNFYKSVFGGEFTMIMRYKDMPAEVPKGDANENDIMHVSLPIGKNTILMGSDSHDPKHKTTAGTNFNISVNADSEKDADKIYKGLSEGGKATMPMAKAFWGAYFGMLMDKFGIQWMVSSDDKEIQSS
ncbi:MAG: VOC family protein [Ignavibacteria bacterium]